MEKGYEIINNISLAEKEEVKEETKEEVPVAEVSNETVVSNDIPSIDISSQIPSVEPIIPVAPIEINMNSDEVTNPSPFDNNIVSGLEENVPTTDDVVNAYNSNFEDTNNASLIASQVDEVNKLTKTKPTIVSEEDQKLVHKYFSEAIETAYNKIVNDPITILRTALEKSTKWIERVNDQGFVDGASHEEAKEIINMYKGLTSESETKEYNDDYGDNSFENTFNL